MKVLLLGDIHGDLGFLRRAIQWGVQRDTTRVLQLGDFGAYWPGSGDWLDRVSAIVKDSGMDRLVFIDGNHEGWHSNVAPGGLTPARTANQRDDDGFVVLNDMVRWADRGTRWSWDGVRFGALGGAVSVDRSLRIKDVSYWLDEAPTVGDLDTLGHEALDVLVTHDAPEWSYVTAGGLRGVPLHEDIASSHVRQLIASAVHNTMPRFVIHGHWHYRYGQDYEFRFGDRTDDPLLHCVRTEGFGANVGRLEDAVGVMELRDGAVTVPCGPAFGRR